MPTLISAGPTRQQPPAPVAQPGRKQRQQRRLGIPKGLRGEGRGFKDELTFAESPARGSNLPRCEILRDSYSHDAQSSALGAFLQTHQFFYSLI